MTAYKYLFLCVIFIFVISIISIFYITDHLITDVRQEITILHKDCAPCTEKYNAEKNNKRASGIVPQYFFSPCMKKDSPFYSSSIEKLELKIEYYSKLRDIFRIIFALSCIAILILILLLLIKKRKYIFEAVTKSKTQRIGVTILVASLCCMYFECIDSDDYDSFPVLSLIMFFISIGMISTFFQRIYRWIQKGE